MTTTIDRLNASQQKLNKLQEELNSSNRLTLTIGTLMLLVLAGYFAYGYREIKHLLEPETLVPYGAQILQERLPDARHAIVQQVSTAAPQWAEQVSQRLRDELPHIREKLQDYFLKQSEEMLKQVTTISEEHLRKALQENKDVLDTHIRELAQNEQLSDAAAEALVTALEGELKQDLKEQSETVLQSVQSLDARVQRLAQGQNLDEEEAIERRILMLARRLQLMEADPTPITAPVVAPLVKAEPAPAAAGEAKPAEAPAAKPAEAPAAEAKPAEAPAAEAKPAEAPAAEAKPAEAPAAEAKPAAP
ncbi:MAG: hypothetical protein U0929_07920 [Planctomycetaceae bacterium]